MKRRPKTLSLLYCAFVFGFLGAQSAVAAGEWRSPRPRPGHSVVNRMSLSTTGNNEGVAPDSETPKRPLRFPHRAWRRFPPCQHP
jgi:hypothetical protein